MFIAWCRREKYTQCLFGNSVGMSIMSEDNIKLGHKYMLYKRAEWIYLFRNRGQ
jgi:hypothetical protein